MSDVSDRSEPDRDLPEGSTPDDDARPATDVRPAADLRSPADATAPVAVDRAGHVSDDPGRPDFTIEGAPGAMLVIISGPSGVGKDTIIDELRRHERERGLEDRRHYLVTVTTRAPRAGEVDGVDYHFVSRDRFLERREREEFAEWAEVHGNLYGTLRSEIDRVFGTGKHAIMAIDVQGARQFSAAFPESVLVFLLPPSVDTLLERLRKRQTEGPEQMVRRLTGARVELEAVNWYQYVVVNDDLERAYAQVASIVDAETVRHRRFPLLNERVRQLADELDREIMKYTRAT